jgi:hypothetical protein
MLHVQVLPMVDSVSVGMMFDRYQEVSQLRSLQKRERVKSQGTGREEF